LWRLADTGPEDAADGDFKLKVRCSLVAQRWVLTLVSVQLMPADKVAPLPMRDENSLAVLEFEQDDQLVQQYASQHPRKPRLDCALLTIRVREDNEEHVRNVRDLCVVAVVFALARLAHRLLVREHVSQLPPRIDTPAPRLSPLDTLMGIWGFPTRPSTPERENAPTSA
jgi:hypothetical protein